MLRAVISQLCLCRIIEEGNCMHYSLFNNALRSQR